MRSFGPIGLLHGTCYHYACCLCATQTSPHVHSTDKIQMDLKN